MVDKKISNGPNDRAVEETIAGTGPGVPDEALGRDQQLPEPPTEVEVAQVAHKLHAPIAETNRT